MVWLRGLLIASLAFIPMAQSGDSQNCGGATFAVGCEDIRAAVQSGGVDLSVSQSTNQGGPSNGRGVRGNSSGTPSRKSDPPREVSCIPRFDVLYNPRCRTVAPSAASPAPSAPANTAGVTLSDVASFRPVVGVDHVEPGGWTVAGLNTNFYVDAPAQTVSGTLLGRPAEVRFTAVGFGWDYGDRTTATRTTPGGSWARLRVGEFDPTPTSHVFADRGDYTIGLRIDYAAAYRFDGSEFVPIEGRITLPANDLRIHAGDATTVLVARDCLRDPHGPGC
jgi:hypothetical protein